MSFESQDFESQDFESQDFESQGSDARGSDTQGFETLAIHAGQEPDPLTGAVVPPIYQTSTYKQDGIGGTRGGYEYSRTANPTRTALETCLAALENGSRAFAFASGMAAEDCLIRTLCRPGDRVLIPGDAYGGTFRLFDKVLKAWGVAHAPVLQTDLAAVAKAAAAQRPRLIWAETPTNPLLSIVDIRALAALAHSHGALLVVGQHVRVGHGCRGLPNPHALPARRQRHHPWRCLRRDVPPVRQGHEGLGGVIRRR